MYTGIIETLGEVLRINRKDNNNLDISIRASFASELKLGQSVAHDGVCLTVVDCNQNEYTVTAAIKTLEITNLKCLEVGSKVNLERSLKLSDRLDGHILQGHIDVTASCVNIKSLEGSTLFTFEYCSFYEGYRPLNKKGSIGVNGISFTVLEPQQTGFSVAIIPYTMANTNLKYLKIEDTINVEFDIIEKCVAGLINNKK